MSAAPWWQVGSDPALASPASASVKLADPVVASFPETGLFSTSLSYLDPYAPVLNAGPYVGEDS